MFLRLSLKSNSQLGVMNLPTKSFRHFPELSAKSPVSRAGLILAAALAVIGWPFIAQAGNAVVTSTAVTDSHYGLFGLLDERSVYGKGAFPEPFLNDDSDLEPNEFRLDWSHSSNGHSSANEFKAEYEKGFGPVTVEIAIPFLRECEGGKVTEGTGNVEIGARAPVWQYVSPSGFFDNTFGVGIELAILTHSALSKNTELVPKIFDDVKIGNFTLQAIAGYSMIFGPESEEGGIRSFEYGCTLGYTISHQTLPIPGVIALIPMLELSGGTQLNKEESGQTSLTGLAGVRVNTVAIGPMQPRLGFGVSFPLNSLAREDSHVGFVTSLIFEF